MEFAITLLHVTKRPSLWKSRINTNQQKRQFPLFRTKKARLLPPWSVNFTQNSLQKNPLGYVHETQHANEKHPTELKIEESRFFRECARKGTFEDYLKRYPNGRFTKEDFELMKDNYESLKAERIFGYIGAIIGLPFFIIIMIWGLIYDGFKYCDKKCIAIACSMDKYFNFSK